jgi:hypothetical protein
MEKQLARKDAKLEAEEKENADLDSKVTQLEIEILEINQVRARFSSSLR